MRKKQLPAEMVTTDKFVHGGQVMGVLPDGRKCFVWGALPGETVTVQLTKRKKDWAEGYAIEVITPSPDRVEPPEPEIYLATSPWQILAYLAEAKAKQSILAETFERERVAVTWLPFYQQEEPYHYRNKMEYNFWFDNETQKVSLALHKRGSHQKIAVQESALASHTINKTGKEIIQYINKNNIEARQLKSVILRSDGNGKVGISLFVKEPTIVKQFYNFYYGRNNIEILYSDPKSPASISTEVLVPAEQQLSDILLGRSFTYSTRSFFQVNVPVYERVLTIIEKAVSESLQSTVLDMYSGVGSIGLSVVPDSKKLIMVETDKESVRQANQNIGNKENVETILSTAESSTEYITGEELVLVDPPRAGLHKDVVERLIQTKPKQIIYLSCNPATQARDVKLLLEAGYAIAYAQGFNFFPRTPHIESLIILNFY